MRCRRRAAPRRLCKRYWREKLPMFPNGRLIVSAAVALVLTSAALGQERRSRIDVQDYTIDAEISPNTSTIAATAAIRFVAVDDGITSATFELNNALNLRRVMDDQGKQLQASRVQQDFSVRVTFDQPIPKGKLSAVIISYEGTLNGQEESPVYGIKFA